MDSPKKQIEVGQVLYYQYSNMPDRLYKAVVTRVMPTQAEAETENGGVHAICTDVQLMFAEAREYVKGVGEFQNYWLESPRLRENYQRQELNRSTKWLLRKLIVENLQSEQVQELKTLLQRLLGEK